MTPVQPPANQYTRGARHGEWINSTTLIFEGDDENTYMHTYTEDRHDEKHRRTVAAATDANESAENTPAGDIADAVAVKDLSAAPDLGGVVADGSWDVDSIPAAVATAAAAAASSAARI